MGGPRNGPPVGFRCHGHLGRSALMARCLEHLVWTAPRRGCRGAHPVGRCAALVAQLPRHGPDPTRIAVALEVPRGAILVTLLAPGSPLFPYTPKQRARS